MNKLLWVIFLFIIHTQSWAFELTQEFEGNINISSEVASWVTSSLDESPLSGKLLSR